MLRSNATGALQHILLSLPHGTSCASIKKYPNRRLYDTEISSYITLEEVRQLVLDGEEFEVRDAKTGDDLTRSVLLQIISEHEERGQPMFTTQLLSQIIRFYGDSLQGFMGSYLEKSLQIFLDQQQQFRSQLNNILGPDAVVDVERPDRAQSGSVEVAAARFPECGGRHRASRRAAKKPSPDRPAA